MAPTINFHDTTDEGQTIDARFRPTVREAIRAALADRSDAETWEITDCYSVKKDAYWFRTRRDGKEIAPPLEIPSATAHTSVKGDDERTSLSSLLNSIRTHFRAYAERNAQ